MTTTELQLKTKRFTAKMNRKELCKVHEMIEDLIDARDATLISKRIREGKEKTFTHEEVKALLDKKFSS